MCNSVGKPVVVMHHVLVSMEQNPRPTRAEATDVANLVLDGVDCLAITTPVAVGAYGPAAVAIMKRICRETEIGMNYRGIYVQRRNVAIAQPQLGADLAMDSLASSAVKVAWDVEATAIVVFTDKGNTARRMALYRPHCMCVCVTTVGRVARQLLLTFGTLPIVVSSFVNGVALTEHVLATLGTRDEFMLPAATSLGGSAVSGATPGGKLLIPGDFIVRLNVVESSMSVWQVPGQVVSQPRANIVVPVEKLKSVSTAGTVRLKA